MGALIALVVIGVIIVRAYVYLINNGPQWAEKAIAAFILLNIGTLCIYSLIKDAKRL